jgi:hypothetical protein
MVAIRVASRSRSRGDPSDRRVTLNVETELRA